MIAVRGFPRILISSRNLVGFRDVSRCFLDWFGKNPRAERLA